MPFSEEDWLIVDDALTSIANWLRKIEREKKQRAKLLQQETIEQTSLPATLATDTTKRELA